MSQVAYEELRNRISENLSERTRELRKKIGDISRSFGNLGLETAVWYPERIHTTNLGGIDGDSYFGYSRIEGKWGLVVRTIERDHENRAFVSQRVFTMEACGNIEIVASALEKIQELLKLIAGITDLQLVAIKKLSGDLDALRDAGGKF